MWASKKQQKSGCSTKLDPSKKAETSRAIESRDMSLKTKVARKVAEHSTDGKAEVTAVWTVDVCGRQTRVSFSRDNLHVWINGQAVPTAAFISDHGYDVDLFFDVFTSKGHIYSDVEIETNQMMNYLVVDSDLLGFDHKDFNLQEKK